MADRLFRVDDTDGSFGAVRHYVTTPDGVIYEVDLTDEHWWELLAELGLYIAHARKNTRFGPPDSVLPATNVKAAKRTAYYAKVVAWANANGYMNIAVNEPPPYDVLLAYIVATGDRL